MIPSLKLPGCIENERWGMFPDSLCEDRKACLSAAAFPDPVYTHGDLTGENVIVDDCENIHVIDFADSRIAPRCYEWPPVVFGLFRCDPAMMEEYFEDICSDEFYEEFTLSVLIHEFGAPILKELCDLGGLPCQSVTDISMMRKLLRSFVESGKMKMR